MVHLYVACLGEIIRDLRRAIAMNCCNGGINNDEKLRRNQEKTRGRVYLGYRRQSGSTSHDRYLLILRAQERWTQRMTPSEKALSLYPCLARLWRNYKYVFVSALTCAG